MWLLSHLVFSAILAPSALAAICTPPVSGYQERSASSASLYKEFNTAVLHRRFPIVFCTEYFPTNFLQMTYDEGVAICAGEGARHAQPRTQQEYDDMLYFMGNRHDLILQ